MNKNLRSPPANAVQNKFMHFSLVDERMINQQVKQCKYCLLDSYNLLLL